MIDDNTLLFIISTLTVLVLVCLTIFLFYVFYKSKSKLERDKERLENEVNRSQLEIREEFMRNAGKELHDNIGQVLSAVKLQLSMSKDKDKHKESIELIGKAVSDIRNLSKVVDPDSINDLGIIESCKNEISRLDRLEHLEGEIYVIGTPFKLDQKVDIILFRIIQESINNCLKHAKSDRVVLSLNFDKPKLCIKLKDYGVGFDTTAISASSGSGLRNMKQRAEMLGASFAIHSDVGTGTTIEIQYQMQPENEQQNPNWNSR